MKTPREVIDQILENKVRLATVDVQKEFIHLDKNNKGEWTLVITKSLLEKSE